MPFGTAQAEPRDLGLAYAQVALRGDVRASQEALRLLAEALPRYPRDAEVLIRLGFLYQQLERNGPAAELYERALQAGSEAPEAATNLGVIYASKGDLRKSARVVARSVREESRTERGRREPGRRAMPGGRDGEGAADTD